MGIEATSDVVFDHNAIYRITFTIQGSCIAFAGSDGCPDAIGGGIADIDVAGQFCADGWAAAVDLLSKPVELTGIADLVYAVVILGRRFVVFTGIAEASGTVSTRVVTVGFAGIADPLGVSLFVGASHLADGTFVGFFVILHMVAGFVADCVGTVCVAFVGMVMLGTAELAVSFFIAHRMATDKAAVLTGIAIELMGACQFAEAAFVRIVILKMGADISTRITLTAGKGFTAVVMFLDAVLTESIFITVLSTMESTSDTRIILKTETCDGDLRHVLLGFPVVRFYFIEIQLVIRIGNMGLHRKSLRNKILV